MSAGTRQPNGKEGRRVYVSGAPNARMWVRVNVVPGEQGLPGLLSNRSGVLLPFRRPSQGRAKGLCMSNCIYMQGGLAICG